MTSEGTTRRSIRIPDKLWGLAITETVKRGDTISSVLRNALINYLIEAGAMTEAQREEFLR